MSRTKNRSPLGSPVTAPGCPRWRLLATIVGGTEQRCHPDRSHLSGTVASMTDDRIWTAEELERLSPDERDRIVKEGIVSDLSQVPADFLARARAKGRALLEERGVITTDGS